jgi:hypothetical protein
VKIAGFCAAKSLVELRCHVLENTISLECLRVSSTGRRRWTLRDRLHPRGLKMRLHPASVGNASCPGHPQRRKHDVNMRHVCISADAARSCRASVCFPHGPAWHRPWLDRRELKHSKRADVNCRSGNRADPPANCRNGAPNRRGRATSGLFVIRAAINPR